MPDLNCMKFEERLAEAVEDRRSPVELSAEASESDEALWRELRSHAHACPACRTLWNEFALLERVLPAWKDSVPAVDLADAVIARWREEQAASNHAVAKPHSDSGRRFNGRPGLTILLAAAATALACVVVFFVPRPAGDDLPDTHLVSKTNPQSPPANEGDSPAFAEKNPSVPLPEADGAERDWQALAQDAGSAFGVLASDTADSFASAAVFVPRPSSPPSPQSEHPNPETKSSSQWMDGIGAGLKPVGHDVGQAMGFLLDVLPGDGSRL